VESEKRSSSEDGRRQPRRFVRFVDMQTIARAVFKFLRRLEDGEPNDPATLVTAVPNWTVGETFTTGRGHKWRILGIDTEIADELIDAGFNGAFTVEPN
jgi:hypothetical protein